MKANIDNSQFLLRSESDGDVTANRDIFSNI